jgi:hypothetical protein
MSVLPGGRSKYGQPNVPRRKYVVSLDIEDPPPGAIESGSTYQLKATATYNTGQIVPDVQAVFTRTVGVDGTATVTSSGLITAVAPGSITVQAKFGKVATQVVVVEDAPAYVDDVYFALPGDPLTELTGPRVLDIGVEETLILVSVDQFGRIMDPSGRTYTFTSNDDTEVEVVSSSGRSVTIGGVDDDGATITGTDTTDDPDVAATMVYTVPAAANVPDYLLVSPNAITMSASGADVQLVARTFTSDDEEILGDVHTFAVHSGSGFTVDANGLVEPTGAGSGVIRVRSGIDTAVLLDINVTVTSAVAGGELANHTGRTPVFLPATRLYELDQLKQLWASNPTSTLGARVFAMIKFHANAAFNQIDNGLYCALMYNLRTPDDTDPMTAQAYANKGIALLFNQYHMGVITSSVLLSAWYLHIYYTTRYIIAADLMYQAMTQTQRDFLGTFCDRVYRGILKLDGGIGAIGTPGDTDGRILPYMTLAMIHYWNIPENPHYLNALNGQVVGGPLIGGVSATGADFNTVRNNINYFMTVLGNGGEHGAGVSYSPHDVVIMLSAVVAIRHAANPTFCQDVVDWADEHAYHNMLAFTDDFALYDQHSDVQTGYEHKLPIKHRWMHMANMSAFQGLTNSAWGQKAANAAIAYMESINPTYVSVNGDGWNADTSLYLYDPLRTAEASAFPWEGGALAADTAAGVGRKRIRRDDTLVALDAVEQPVVIHHQQLTASDYRMNIAGKWAIDHVQSHTGALDVSAYYNNTIIILGSHTHFKPVNGTYKCIPQHIREEGGSAGSVLWESVTGRINPPGYFNTGYSGIGVYPPATIVKLEHHHIYVYDPVTGWNAVIVCYDVETRDPKASLTAPIYPSGWTAAEQTMIDNAQTRTGSLYPKEVQLFAATTPTVGSDLITWTVPSGPDVRVVILSPTSATIQHWPANYWVGTQYTHPSEYDTERVIRWWGGTSAAEAKTHVVMAGTGSPPSDPTLVGGNPKIISFAGKTFTIGASSITVT